MPCVPSSRAQLLPVDVAVNQRCICALDPLLLMGPDIVSSSFLSRWRCTLRRLLLASSRAVSPRPLPSRTFTGWTVHVAVSGPTDGAPHGVAPLPSSLSEVALPQPVTRSFLGFAFKQAQFAGWLLSPAPPAGLLSNIAILPPSSEEVEGTGYVRSAVRGRVHCSWLR